MDGLNESITLPMHEKQFEFAIKGINLSKQNIEYAKQVLVEERPRSEILAQSGMSNPRLGQILFAIADNYETKLAELGLHRVEVIVDDKQKKKIESDEDKLLNTLLDK